MNFITHLDSRNFNLDHGAHYLRQLCTPENNIPGIVKSNSSGI